MPELPSHSLTGDQLDLLVKRAGGHDQALAILSGALDFHLLPSGDGNVAAPTTTNEQIVDVPVQQAFEDRVARGSYGWRHDKLVEDRFPVTEDQFGRHAQKLFHFNRSISSQAVIAEIRDAGYEPGRIGDILVFGERFPDVQRRHPVIGLGSVVDVDGSLSMPALWFDGDRRTLDLIWYDGDWHRNYRFLGVRPLT